MPKNAQQIIDDFQSLERKERQEKVDHLYDVSHGLDTFAKEFADHDDELDVEQKQDLFHMFQGMKALNTIAQMASGEKNLNEKQLNYNVEKLAGLKLDTMLAKTIDEKTAKTIGRPEWAGKTYHEALADHLEDDEYIDIKDFDESLAFVNT